jgi:UDP-glucose 4-epimerase
MKFVKGDIRNMDDIEAAVDGCDVIFNLAASVGNKRSIDNPIEDSEINVMGTLKVLEVARRHNIKKIVHSSSAGIFGELKQLPINEDHPQDPNSPYGISKLAAEKQCLIFNDLYSMNNVCLRYFNVYGVNQRYDAYGNVIPIFALRLLSGMPLFIYGDGDQTRDFINVHDVARANIMSALSEKVHGVFNLGCGSTISINDLADLMMKKAGVKAEIQYLSPRKGDVRDSMAFTDKLVKAVNYKPSVDLPEGIEAYFEWLKKDPLLPVIMKKVFQK